MKDLKSQLIKLGATHPKTQPPIRKILGSLDDILRNRKRVFDLTVRGLEEEIVTLVKEQKRLEKEIEFASDQGGGNLSKLEKAKAKVVEELKKSRTSLVNVKDLYEDLSK